MEPENSALQQVQGNLKQSSEIPTKTRGPMRGGFTLAEGLRDESIYHHGVDPKRAYETPAVSNSGDFPVSSILLILSGVAFGFWGFFRQERIKAERLDDISHTRHGERARVYKKSNFLLVLKEYEDQKLSFNQTKIILINTFNFSEEGALEILQNI